MTSLPRTFQHDLEHFLIVSKLFPDWLPDKLNSAEALRARIDDVQLFIALTEIEEAVIERVTQVDVGFKNRLPE